MQRNQERLPPNSKVAVPVATFPVPTPQHPTTSACGKGQPIAAIVWVVRVAMAETLSPGSGRGFSCRSAQCSGAGLEFKAPSAWIQEASSTSMRLAQYRLPRLEGGAEDAELVVYHFGGQGGSVQANVNRWIGQVSNADGSSVFSRLQPTTLI